MNFAVQTERLTKTHGHRQALEAIDLRIASGTVYGLLGPNGAGKTTLLKLLTGLLRPTAGTIHLFGEPWRRSQLARVGALIEAPAVYGNLTGLENLLVHARLLGLPRARCHAVLAEVDLTAAAGQRAGTYSLGMKQRLGLALALLSEPDLLILDEPTNGLDPVGIRELRAQIRGFAARGITVLVSSHILAEIAQIATHLGVIANGQLRFQGPLTGLVRQEQGYLLIETPTATAAAEVLRPHHPALRIEEGRLLIPVLETESAAIVGALSAAGITIARFSYQTNTLESRFMALLGEEVA